MLAVFGKIDSPYVKKEFGALMFQNQKTSATYAFKVNTAESAKTQIQSKIIPFKQILH